MQLDFHYSRTLQSAAALLRKSPGLRMNYMRMLKLLYIAERELLAQHALSLTGDRPVAMQRGPVLSQTYDLILGKGEGAGDWAKHIAKDHYDVCLTTDPENGLLSKAILAKLDEVGKRYEDLDEWDMVEETHKFDEWRKNFPSGGISAYPFSWDDALAAQGKTHLISHVECDERASTLFDAMARG